MKNKTQLLLVLAIAGGLFLAAGYVNPYDGKILLSELVLQLSGSRGEIPLGVSMPELLSLIMRMLPNCLFEIYFGTVLYRHFCTASIYVFSRYPKRIHWYLKEALALGAIVCLYQIILSGTVIITTSLRYQLRIDESGIILLLYHFLIHTVWVYCITLIMNLIAVKGGSSLAFVLVMGAQTICVTALGCIRFIMQYLDAEFLKAFLKLNPIAHLVLGWHGSDAKAVEQVLNPPFPGLGLNDSLFYFMIICVVTVLTGAFLVKKHDLLISNMEEGAF